MATQHFAPQWLFDGQQLHQNVIVSISINQNTNQNQISNLQWNCNAEQLNASHVTHLQGILSPGLVDVQVNGGGGVQFNHAPSLASLKTIITAHRSAGTAAILPTVITDDVKIMAAAADAVSEAIKQKVPGIIGIHFEGPHLSVPKRGVHPEQYIRAISDAEKAIFARTDLGHKLITIAPEQIKADDIQWLTEQGWVVSIGHTNAPFEQHLLALGAGATGFTHLYNAMSPLTSREPGAVGAALYAEDAFAGIILDGHHCDYVCAKLAWHLKHKHQGKLFLVSDAMASAASELTEFDLFGETVKVAGGRLTTSNGTLAGAHLTLLEAAQNAVHELELSIDEALRMATSYPMQFLQNPNGQFGQITIGAPADLILLDEKLNLVQTVFCE
jgi:N-acetylglucosamine-6-phosphate deacetylase